MTLHVLHYVFLGKRISLHFTGVLLSSSFTIPSFAIFFHVFRIFLFTVLSFSFHFPLVSCVVHSCYSHFGVLFQLKH